MTDVSAILGEPVTLEGKGGFTLTYQPASFTPKIITRWSSLGQDEAKVSDLMDAYCQLLPVLVLEWDLVIDGNPVPLTPEALEDVPLGVLDHAWELIQEDRDARRSEEKNDSNASTEAKPSGSTSPSFMGAPQNGIASLPQPVSTAVPSGTS